LNTLSIKKEIRGHAFIWNIRIPKEISNIKERSRSKGKELGNGVIQLFIKNRFARYQIK
jgi:hypothetical protein